MCDRNNRKEYGAQYYENNKERILEMYKVRVNCPNCNRELNQQNLVSHMKTKLCINKSELNKILNK